MQDILTTVLIMCLILGALAFLLTLASRTIANYGEVSLLVNEEKEYTVEGGDTLLSALFESSIYIPSACGGKGSCGYCKVQVDEGGGDILPTELGYINDEEKSQGVRLSCQLKVKAPIKIRIPESLLSVKQFDYHLQEIVDLTPTIKLLRLALPEHEEIIFKAGQYIQLLAPQYKGSPEEVYRAYSIASSPEKTNAIDLYIGYVKEGVATTYVHNHLKKGDTVTLVGPYGDFYYRQGDDEMIMVAVGTGMAPIMSILKLMRDQKIDRKVTFFFGARTREDLFEEETLQELMKDLPQFKMITCLSKPTDECQWEGEVGRVTDMLEKHLNREANKEAYLCGSPMMIDSVIPILKAKGLEDNKIYYDRFE